MSCLEVVFWQSRARSFNSVGSAVVHRSWEVMQWNSVEISQIWVLSKMTLLGTGRSALGIERKGVNPREYSKVE
jgi:hypothetical protein